MLSLLSILSLSMVVVVVVRLAAKERFKNIIEGTVLLLWFAIGTINKLEESEEGIEEELEEEEEKSDLHSSI